MDIPTVYVFVMLATYYVVVVVVFFSCTFYSQSGES